jgi:uncharacterized repeat protein (TIGR01451 family)
LHYESPLINAGHPAGVQPLGPAPRTDIDSDFRPQGLAVDVGVDEVSPLAASALEAKKTRALPRSIIVYTLTLTSTGTAETLSVRVTDTLPSETEYIPGSLKASGGRATYLPASGSLLLPQIIWTGQVMPGRVVHINFAVAIRLTALYCVDVTNVAHIRSDSAAGRAEIQRRTTTHMSADVLGRIAMYTTPDMDGTPVGALTLQAGDTITVHAVGYDNCGNFLGPVTVAWQTSGTLARQTGHGSSFAFSPSVGGSTGHIIASIGRGYRAESGPITVLHRPPHIALSTPSLTSVQRTDHHLTQTLTISNSGGLTLTYELVSTPQPFELTYVWDDSIVVNMENDAWNYYFTPEQIAPELIGGDIKVTEVEFKSGGTNVSDWINFDLEVHLSNQPIGLPEGQQAGSLIDPWLGFERNAPSQLLLVIGQRQLSSSYNYHVDHDFITGSTSATPFLGYVKTSLSSLLQITDGLYAQVALWTGDPRVTLQFNGIELRVRGVVTYTQADWLTVTPVSGTLGTNASQVVHTVFDSNNLPNNVYHTSIAILSNDPDQAISKIPTRMWVIGAFESLLPVVLKTGQRVHEP